MTTVHTAPLWERLLASLIICIFAGVIGTMIGFTTRAHPWTIVVFIAAGILGLLVRYTVRRARLDWDL